MNMNVSILCSKEERVEIVGGEMHGNARLRTERPYGSRRRPVSLPQVSERLPELVAGAMDVGLHRPEGQVEHLGDFFVGPALDVT